MNRSRAKRRLAFRHLSLRRLRSESGFAIVEVMVSAVLLVVVGTATFSLIDQSAGQSASNRSRAVAVSLAEQDQDRLRAIPFTQLGDVNQTTTKTLRGITYTIQSQAQYASDTAGVVACAADSGSIEYLQIATTVTWPDMRNVQPVRLESLVTPNVGNVAGGALTVVMTKANGSPQPGLSVSVGGTTKTTDAGGCARWTNLTAGDYTVAFDTPGYLTPAGVQSYSESVSVKAKQTSNKSYAYDQAAGLDVFVKHLDGTAKRWRSATVVSGSTSRTMPASAGTTPSNSFGFTGLYPFTDGYKAYAGRCIGNDPATYRSDFFTTNPGGAVIPTPAVTSPVNTYVRTVRLQATKTNSGSGGTLSSGELRVRVSPSGTGMAGCESVARQQVGLVGSSTEFPATSQNFTTSTSNGIPRNTVILDIPLPYGIWDICVDNNNSRRKILTAYRNTPDAAVPAPDTATPSIIDLGLTSDIARKDATSTTPSEPFVDYNGSNC